MFSFEAGPLVQMGITRVAKVFVAGAILSALLNVGLVFYITQHWVPNDAASIGGAMIKTNGGKAFSFEVYDENDIVSDAVKQDGWERNVVASLNEYFQDYSEVNNVSLRVGTITVNEDSQNIS